MQDFILALPLVLGLASVFYALLLLRAKSKGASQARASEDELVLPSSLGTARERSVPQADHRQVEVAEIFILEDPPYSWVSVDEELAEYDEPNPEHYDPKPLFAASASS